MNREIPEEGDTNAVNTMRRVTVRSLIVVSREDQSGYLPRLKTTIGRIEEYDAVFLGFPTWGMQLPPPIKSFLRGYNLKGKTVVPFNTNAGYGEGSSFRTVRDLCSECTLLEGFVTRGGVERDGQHFVIWSAVSRIPGISLYSARMRATAC